MIVHRDVQVSSGNLDTLTTIDQVETTDHPCLANVGPSDRRQDYQSCGERLRKRNNGSTYCPEHGAMH